MKSIRVEQIKVLSDPNRLAILSLLTMREMTTSQVSDLLGLSIQNTNYHMKKLLSAEVIVETRSKTVGNLVERYYRSMFEPGEVDEVTNESGIEISERLDLIFAALGAIKGILDAGIDVLDNRWDYFKDVEKRPNYPFNANYVIVSNTEDSRMTAEGISADLDGRMRELSSKDDGVVGEKFAIMYAIFPYK